MIFIFKTGKYGPSDKATLGVVKKTDTQNALNMDQTSPA